MSQNSNTSPLLSREILLPKCILEFRTCSGLQSAFMYFNSLIFVRMYSSVVFGEGKWQKVIGKIHK